MTDIDLPDGQTGENVPYRMSDRGTLERAPTDADVTAAWAASFQRYAPIVRSVLQTLCYVPAEHLENCLRDLNHFEAVGPLFDPTAFASTPGSFENLRRNRELVEAVLKLRRLLPNEPTQ